MTISRCRLTKRADLRIIHADSCDPDDISFEVWKEDQEILSINVDVDGKRSIYLGQFEFDAMEFQGLIEEGLASIAAWEKSLREPGGAWSGEGE